MPALTFDDTLPKKLSSNAITFDDITPENTQQSGNAVERIFSKRANQLADNIVAYRNDEINAPELALRAVGGAAAGTANDLMGEAASAVVPSLVKRGTVNAAQAASDAIDSTGAGQYLGDKLLQARDAYSRFAGRNPNLVQDVGSALNLAAFIPAANAVQSGARSVASAVAPPVRGVEAASSRIPGILGNTASGRTMKVRPLPISDDAVRGAARNAYKDVDLLGGGFTPQLSNEAHSIIQNAKVKPFAGDILTKQDKLINDALADYDTLAGKTLSLDDYRRLDSSLGDKMADAFVSGRPNEGRIISGVQDRVRGLIEPSKLNQKYISGSREGVDALTNDAIPLWVVQSKLADLQKIADRASVMDNPTTAIRTGYRNLMLSKRFATYPKDVQKLIVKAADTGVVDDLLSVVGSRLNQIAGGTIGGAPGFAVSTVTSAGARGIRNKLRNNRANKVVDALVNPVRGSVQKYDFVVPENVGALSMKEIMQMPPAQARAALARLKDSRLEKATQ